MNIVMHSMNKGFKFQENDTWPFHVVSATVFLGIVHITLSYVIKIFYAE